MFFLVVYTEPEPHDTFLPRIQYRGKRAAYYLLQLAHFEHFYRRGSIRVFYEVDELAVLLVPYGGLERNRVLRNLEDAGDLVRLHADLLGYLLGQRLSPKLLHEEPRCPDNPVYSLRHVDGYPDDPRLVGEGSGYRLSYPPRRISGEFITPVVFEFLDRPHEPHIALLDEVEERKAPVDIAPGNAHHETEVGLYELPPRPVSHLLPEFYPPERLLQQTGISIGIDEKLLHGPFQGFLGLRQ